MPKLQKVIRSGSGIRHTIRLIFVRFCLIVKLLYVTPFLDITPTCHSDPDSISVFLASPLCQNPYEYMMRGYAMTESGEEEPVGLELIGGYHVKVLYMQFLAFL